MLLSSCRVENLFSEIQFIQDFAGSTLLTEEYGFLLTELKVCQCACDYKFSCSNHFQTMMGAQKDAII